MSDVAGMIFVVYMSEDTEITNPPVIYVLQIAFFPLGYLML